MYRPIQTHTRYSTVQYSTVQYSLIITFQSMDFLDDAIEEDVEKEEKRREEEEERKREEEELRREEENLAFMISILESIADLNTQIEVT